MLRCNSCCIYETCKRKEVGGLKLSYGENLKGLSQKFTGRGALFMGELTSLVFYQRITYLFQPYLVYK